MYFIFESGGKQYKVSPGQKVRVEKLPVEVGKQFSFDRLVMKADDDKVDFGSPYLKGETLEARVIQHGRGDKIPVIKFKRRKHYLKRLNHRQEYTEVEILRLAAAKSEKQQKQQKQQKQEPTSATVAKKTKPQSQKAKAGEAGVSATKEAKAKAKTETATKDPATKVTKETKATKEAKELKAGSSATKEAKTTKETEETKTT